MQKTAERTETETLFANLDKPSLANLSYVLRHPDTWPKGFEWQYRYCDQCAMGLAHRLWTAHVDNTNTSSMARAFAMPWSEASKIFQGDGDWVPRQRCGFLWLKTGPDWDCVTPEMVADAIDAYLARAE